MIKLTILNGFNSSVNDFEVEITSGIRDKINAREIIIASSKLINLKSLSPQLFSRQTIYYTCHLLYPEVDKATVYGRSPGLCIIVQATFPEQLPVVYMPSLSIYSCGDSFGL